MPPLPLDAATDTSASQVSKARVLPNVRYSVGDAHDTQLPGGEADLVTVAQAGTDLACTDLA